jgi:hypothetical protein
MMELVKVELNVPKESKEVVDFLALIFDEAKQGLGVDDIAKLLPGLMQAIEGLDKVDDEIKGKNRDDLMGYLVKQIGSKLE